MARRLAFLGPAGTFTEEAALNYDPQAQHIPFTTIHAVAAAAISGMADMAIVPIENSLEGSVTDTLDLLIHESGLFIHQELVLAIEHCLLAQPGSKAEEIRVIYSHPQALAQCRRFLEKCFPKAQMVASLSTAAAVQEMKQSQITSAAIANRRASQLYSVEVMDRGIQDNPSNVTRFVILASADHPPTGSDMTSLCFSFTEDRPGQLHSVLGEFAQRGINLGKIESRPTKQTLGSYIFLVDLEGHKDDPKVREALEGVRRHASILKIFGSYPKNRQPLASG